MYPHNYYLEVLTEVGLIGFLLNSVFYNYLFNFIKMYFKKNKLNNYIIVPFVFLFISEIFLLRAQVVFYYGNATYLFLILSFVVTIMRKIILLKTK